MPWVLLTLTGAALLCAVWCAWWYRVAWRTAEADKRGLRRVADTRIVLEFVRWEIASDAPGPFNPGTEYLRMERIIDTDAHSAFLTARYGGPSIGEDIMYPGDCGVRLRFVEGSK